MYTQEALFREWVGSGNFDFLYLPQSGHGKWNVGYAFVNFVTASDLVTFMNRWSDASLTPGLDYTRKTLKFAQGTVQGLAANIVQAAKKDRSRYLDTRPIIIIGGRRVSLEAALHIIAGPHVAPRARR